MKKVYMFLCIMLMCIFLTGCNDKVISEEISYSKLYKANTFIELFKTYDSVSYSLTNYLDEEENFNLYASRDLFVIEKNNKLFITYNDKNFYYDKDTDIYYTAYNKSNSTFKDDFGENIVIRNKNNDKDIMYFKDNRDTISYYVSYDLVNENDEENELKGYYDLVINKKDLSIKEFTSYKDDNLKNKKIKLEKISDVKLNEANAYYTDLAKKLDDDYANVDNKLNNTDEDELISFFENMFYIR